MDDKKKESLGEKIKEGVSVQEIEKFARNHTPEVFLILAILVGCVSSVFDFFTGSALSIIFAGIGAVVSILLPEKIKFFHKKLEKIAFKKEKSTQITFGIIRIAVALFIPFLFFAEMGILAGMAFHKLMRDAQKEQSFSPPQEKKEE